MLIQDSCTPNTDRYNGQAIRLLSCNMGALDNGFAQNLANKLNVEVCALKNYLWSEASGNYFVAGMTKTGLTDMHSNSSMQAYLNTISSIIGAATITSITNITDKEYSFSDDLIV